MKTNLLYSLAAFAIMTLPTNTVKASEAPESNKYHITTVRWIKATDNSLDEDERYVVLCGTVTKKEGDETYWLNDGTGTVKLDSEKKLPVGKPIVIRGHIDQAWLGWGSQEVDVRTWRNEPAPK
jgi:uncharacterized protein YdeI (BOF family)